MEELDRVDADESVDVSVDSELLLVLVTDDRLLLSVDVLDSLLSVLLESDVWLELELVAEEVLDEDSVDELRLDSVDADDELREWLLLDVLSVTLLSDPVEKLDDRVLVLLVLSVRLLVLLESDDSVDTDDSDETDWLDLLVIDDCGELLLLLPDEDDSVLLLRVLLLSEESVLTLLLLEDSVDVLEVLSDEVLDVLSDDSDDAVRLDVLSVDVLLVDRLLVVRLEALDVLSSSTPMIRRSPCAGPSCPGPLVTIRISSSLVGKSRMHGANSTPPIVSRNSARHSRLAWMLIVSTSVVAAIAWVVRWSENTPLTAA